jgi:hypothetical protein
MQPNSDWRFLFLLEIFLQYIEFIEYFTSGKRTPLSLRFSPSEVTLSRFAGGEYLPLPASKGPAFPFLLTLDGDPTSPGICAQEQWCSLRTPETPE